MAGRGDDNDKTQFGGRLDQNRPGQPPQSGNPFGQPAPGGVPSRGSSPFPSGPGGDDRTVIGNPGAAPGGGAYQPSQYPPGHYQPGQFPPSQQGFPPPPGPGQYPAPPSGAGIGQPYGQNAGGTWVGAPGSQPGGAPYPGQPSGYPPPYPPPGQPPHAPQGHFGGPPPGQSASPFEQSSQIGRAAGQGDEGFFPQFHRPEAAPRQTAPRIPLHEALRVRDLGAASSSNPLLAAASTLLILLGRLRTGLVELQVAPLMEHVTREIERFEHNARSAGVDPHEVLVAKYALSGTADDIVQNLPGADRGSWQQYSMVARFFHKRDSGVGFFQEVEKALQAPAQRYNLLELMLVCLSLGFEGQFRTMPNGAVQLARYRNAIYESLRRVKPRPDEDISPLWQPIEQGRRRFMAIPVPAIMGIGAVAVLAIFATLSTLINRDGSAVAAEMRALHKGAPTIQLDRSPAAEVFVAPETTQLQRIRDAFAAEIADGRVEVEQKGDYIAIRVGNLQLFDTAAVEVKPGFADLANRIAEVLNAEAGPILIEGHTDNVPMSGRGQYKDNYQLSQARADSVKGVLDPLLADAARVESTGRGEDDPVGDNATEEGRSANRRVEILLARDGTFEAPAAGTAPAPAEAAAAPAADAEPAATGTEQAAEPDAATEAQQ